jgi:hypothetical protein
MSSVVDEPPPAKAARTNSQADTDAVATPPPTSLLLPPPYEDGAVAATSTPSTGSSSVAVAAADDEGEPSITCSVCHELPYPPTTLPCGHVLCLPCAQSLQPAACPECRSVFCRNGSAPALSVTHALRTLLHAAYPRTAAAREASAREAEAQLERERVAELDDARAVLRQLFVQADEQRVLLVLDSHLIFRLLHTGTLRALRGGRITTVQQLGDPERLVALLEALVDGSEYDFVERLLTTGWRPLSTSPSEAYAWRPSTIQIHGARRLHSYIYRVAQIGAVVDMLPSLHRAAMGSSLPQDVRHVVAANYAWRLINAVDDKHAMDAKAALHLLLRAMPCTATVSGVDPDCARVIRVDAVHCTHCTGGVKACTCPAGCPSAPNVFCYPIRR